MNKCAIIFCCLLTSFPLLISAPHSGSEPLLATYACDGITGYCYKTGSTEVVYTDAWLECHDQGMFLAMPRTNQEIDFLRNNVLGTENHYHVWIGLTDIQTDGRWSWNDQQSLDTGIINDPWKDKEPKDSKGHDEDCVEIRQAGWNNALCESVTDLALCQSYTTACTFESPYLFDDYCYQIYTGRFGASINPCPNGGTLAMPTTEDINNFLYDINIGDVNMWIGLCIPGGQSDWIWTDGNTTTGYETLLGSHFLSGAEIMSDPNQSLYAYMTPTGSWDSSQVLEETTISYVCQFPREKIDCGNLIVTYMVDITSNTKEDAVHVVTCVNGYDSVYPITTCFVNGSWAPTPVCIRGCGDLVVSNMVSITSNTKEDDSHAVTCNNGYSSTTPTTTCMNDGSWTPMPSCKRDCGDLVADNMITITGNTWENTTHHVTCNVGYSSVTSSASCMTTGSWSILPSCIRDCGIIAIPDGTTISTNTTAGYSHTVACNSGFTAVAPSTTCMSDGTWIPDPVCILDCGTVAVPNGFSISDNTTLDYSHPVSCHLGFTSNVSKTTCTNDGNWTPEPECVLDEDLFCVCYEQSNTTFLDNIIAELIRHLTVDKDTLSKTRRQLTSAEDGRLSAKCIGVSGAIIMAVFCSFFVIFDAINILNYGLSKKKKIDVDDEDIQVNNMQHIFL